MMMLRLVFPFALLLTNVVGSNAKLIRGMSRTRPQTQIRKLSPSTCQCTFLCRQCYKLGINDAPCRSACAYAKSSSCVELCNAFLHGTPIRDDANTQPPLPPDAPQPAPTSPPATEAPQPPPTSPPVTEAPQPPPTSSPATEAPQPPPTSPPVAKPTRSGAIRNPVGTCQCTILCQQCELQGIDNTQCQTACAYSKEPNCGDLCDDFIKGIGIRDDTYAPPPLPAEPPTPIPTCYCVTLCEQCKAVGSTRAACVTVCEFAELPNAECTTNCNAALHLGNP
jgi:hypothetical protein